MHVKKAELPVLVANLIYIPAFGLWSLLNLNYEFVIYALVIVVFFALVFAFQRRVEFGLPILWGLTLWGFLHMAGGMVHLAGDRLYGLVLLPIATFQDVPVLRYDHAVHALGFGVATLVCAHLLRPYLASGTRSRVVLGALVALMGMGLGALNEVIELLVVLVLPQTGVGGYYNTAFDLLFNMVGAAIAAAWAVRKMAARAG